MKFYEFGSKDKPSLMLLPGTCCHWKNNFGHVIERLSHDFYVICVSYDGFDETEQTQFKDMITEAEKIEEYIKENLEGKIHAIYGCSLGGSFIGILMQRNIIHMNHGILGSSDLDQMNETDAEKSGSRLVPIIYYFIKKKKPNILLVKFLRWKMGREYADFLFKMMFGANGQSISFVSKESIERQYVSDLITELEDGIEVEGTTVHCFYAVKMGEIYLKRYKKHFKNPHIVTSNLRHEELLACRSGEWIQEINKCVLNNK